MRELFRVLKPGGWAILQSPVDYNRDKTFEDPNIVSPDE
jgi:SAM-dependent methyltransferase